MSWIKKMLNSCFIFWFYIKPQPVHIRGKEIRVASYFDSTSNHNLGTYPFWIQLLLHILILHQTTTWRLPIPWQESFFIFWFYIKPQPTHPSPAGRWGCFIFWFYIKPQQTVYPWAILTSCFIFWFYIKPQHIAIRSVSYWVASYFDSTSNHNGQRTFDTSAPLLHILILHQTTTVPHQSRHRDALLHILILHQTTTSPN